jgi:hypothetical protein
LLIKAIHNGIASLFTVLIIVVSLLVFSKPILADSGTTINGSYLVSDVSPGQTLKHLMTVTNNNSTASSDIKVTVAGILQSPSGSYKALAADEDSYFQSAREFISLDKISFTLQPGTSQPIEANIDIPLNVKDGGYYSLISFEIKSSAQQAVAYVTTINVPIFLTIKNTRLIHTGKIISVNSTRTESGKPVIISTLLQNTGNHHFKVKEQIAITDDTGRLLDTIFISPPGSVIPTMSKEIQATYIPKSGLSSGNYQIQSKVALEDGTLLDEATGSFEVKAPYVPPPAPASTSVIPSNSSTLKTDDGRIVIDFPAGAVLGDAQLSLRSYYPDQLPSPPAGYTAGTTAFRVDGLNGLLAKPATMKVKYSTSDLDKAGGDATRLVLGRWDEAGSNWSLLKTTLDASTQTLAAQSNQFSIGAILVSPQMTTTAASVNTNGSETNWTLIGGIILLAVIIVLYLAIFVFFKPKKRVK